jgi:hypothetical protein
VVLRVSWARARGTDRGDYATSEDYVTLGLVAALTGLCFAGAVAAIAIGLSR